MLVTSLSKCIPVTTLSFLRLADFCLGTRKREEHLPPAQVVGFLRFCPSSKQLFSETPDSAEDWELICSMVGAAGELRFKAFELMELQSMQVAAALRLGMLHARLTQGGICS